MTTETENPEIENPEIEKDDEEPTQNEEPTPAKARWVKNAFFSVNPPATKYMRLDELHNLANKNLDGVCDTTDFELAEMILERANLKEHVMYHKMLEGLTAVFGEIPDPAMQYLNPSFKDSSMLVPKVEIKTRGIKKEGSKFSVKVTDAPENAKGTLKLHQDWAGGGKIQEWTFKTDKKGNYQSTVLVNPLEKGRHYFATNVGILPFLNSYFEVEDDKKD